MRDVREEEIERLEAEAFAAESELAREIADADSDATEVAGALREVRLRLEEEQLRGASGVDALITALYAATAPTVPLDNHHARLREVRLDALRARLWVVSAMRDDLKRFTFELGDAIKLCDEGRDALQRLAEQPRINVRPRLERIRAITADLAARAATESATSHPRRMLPRLKLETAIDLHSQSNFYTGHTENISDGGLFLATDADFEVGTEVDLVFTVPDVRAPLDALGRASAAGIEIRARGVVRWSRDESSGFSPGVGIAFTYLSRSAHEAIQDFLTLREPIIHSE